MIHKVFLLACACLWVLPAVEMAAAAEPTFTLKKGDHICLIGNALAERMQHHGWLETLIQSRFPKHELLLRNLGFSGDELGARLRSAGFGSPDEYLSLHKTDVVFALFGYNESFAGARGLDKFKQDLANFIQHTRGQQYNGHSAPRLVLFSSIAHENLNNPDLPDGKENNRRIELYTRAMAEVARANKVLFVDLFHPTLDLYASSSGPLTINGLHLNEQGNRQLALVMERALLGGHPPGKGNVEHLEKIRTAVVDKNFFWFHRYRTTDGYNVYGGRSHLKFTDNITNRVVMQREMQVLDAMAASRDRRIWAVAQGKDYPVDDSTTPPFIPVKTNKPGPGPGGKHLFLSGQAALGKMKLAEGMKVNLFATEEEFPALINPVQMAFDSKGRLWVAAWSSYPHWKPKDKMDDKLLILEDTDGDGKADQCKVFADRLHNPTGFEFYGGGVIVAMAPDLLLLKDTDGDDKADYRERILHGIDSADTHHTANSFLLSPGGALFFQEGTFHQSQIETLYQGALRCNNACVWRFEPRTWKVDRYIPYDFANPHGHVFDRWGNGFVYDGTSARPWHDTLFSGHLDFPQKHPAPPQLYQQRTRPCPGVEILSSRHFPEQYQGNLLVGNVIGFQGILQYRIEQAGASHRGVEIEPILFSSDPNFRPTDIEIGPDGAIYFTEWQNPIIGHMQHHIRDPNRDQEHGRVYRITYTGRPLLQPPQVADEPIERLLDLLKQPEDRLRYRAKIELSGRDTGQVIDKLNEWTAALDKADPQYEHQLMEALWMHQYHNVVNGQLLRRMLRSPNHQARAAATRVLCYWRGRVSDPLGLLAARASDKHPRVRLEAVRACSFFPTAKAAEVTLLALAHPTDQYISYTLGETIRQLQPYWKKAIREGVPLAADNPAGMNYLMRKVSTAELVKLPRTRVVYQALLSRDQMLHEHRHEGLMGLAKLNKTDMTAELLAAIVRLDKSDSPGARNVLFDLAHMFTSQEAATTAKYRGQIEKLASSARRRITRKIAYLTLITADKSLDKAWRRASTSPRGLHDLIDAVPLIPDNKLREAAYPKIEPLLDGLPKPLAQRASKQQSEAIRQAAINAITYTGVNEKDTFTKLARFVREGKSRAAAVRALSRIGRSNWPEDQIGPLIDSIVAHVSKLPVKQRTKPAVLDELALGKNLASVLPRRQAARAREALGEVGVQIILLRPVPHKMLYDRTQIFVEAGKPVEIVFENIDIMPHNVVITQPGALATVGIAAERMASQPDAFAKNFIPDVPQVLFASTMLQPTQSVRLSFTAPNKLGEYPYVCTFPGHWRRMYGTMYVVASLDDVPLDALAPASDPQIQTRPFVRAWTVEELYAEQHKLDRGRSFERGKELFTTISCVQCHRMNGQGGQVGPDLADVRKKLMTPEFKRIDLMWEMVEPSKLINEKFQTVIIEDTDGRLHSGIVVHKNEQSITLETNPLEKKKPVVLPLKQIEEILPSKVSLMPVGLLNTLTKEEVYDLMAYIESGGDPKHPAFNNSK